MQVTVQPETATLPDMPGRKPDHRGVATRQAILRALRERHDADLPPLSLREIGAVIGKHWTTVHDHIKPLQFDGLIRAEYGSVRLTAAGLRATEQFAKGA